VSCLRGRGRGGLGEREGEGRSRFISGGKPVLVLVMYWQRVCMEGEHSRLGCPRRCQLPLLAGGLGLGNGQGSGGWRVERTLVRPCTEGR